MADSAIDHIRVFIGTNGEGFYTAMYANGEPGPHSEGYRGRTEEERLKAAAKAAERDFPGVDLRYDVDTGD